MPRDERLELAHEPARARRASGRPRSGPRSRRGGALRGDVVWAGKRLRREVCECERRARARVRRASALRAPARRPPRAAGTARARPAPRTARRSKRRLDLEQVAARPRVHDVLGAERPPQPRHVHLQRLGRVRGRASSQSRSISRPLGDHLAVVQKQQREQARCFLPPSWTLPCVALDLEWTKDAELHCCASSRPNVPRAAGPQPDRNRYEGRSVWWAVDREGRSDERKLR